jgi:hypothetical protein
MPLTNTEYVLFALVTLFLCPVLAWITLFCWMYVRILLVIPLLVIGLLAHLVRLSGRNPYLYEESDMLAAVQFLWPLTFAPVHFLNYRVLGWSGGACLLLMFASWLVVAFAIVFSQAQPRR